MVLLIIIPTKWLFHWGYTLFSDKPMWNGVEKIGPWSASAPLRCQVRRDRSQQIWHQNHLLQWFVGSMARRPVFFWENRLLEVSKVLNKSELQLSQLTLWLCMKESHHETSITVVSYVTDHSEDRILF